MLVAYFKVVFENGLCLLLSIVDIINNLAVLEEYDTRTDINGVLQVVAAYHNRSTGLFVVLLQQVLDGVLTAGVEEVEWFIEDKHLGA